MPEGPKVSKAATDLLEMFQIGLRTAYTAGWKHDEKHWPMSQSLLIEGFRMYLQIWDDGAEATYMGDRMAVIKKELAEHMAAMSKDFAGE